MSPFVPWVVLILLDSQWLLSLLLPSAFSLHNHRELLRFGELREGYCTMIHIRLGVGNGAYVKH